MLWLLVRSAPHTLPISRRVRFLSQIPYIFHVAADWAGKPFDDSEPSPPKKKFPSNSAIGSWRDKTVCSHITSKLRSTGEDFLFYTNARQNSGMFLGVADGVGSWSDRGIDPSIFSQALMYYAHEHCQNGKAGEPTSGTSQEKEMTPLECMQLAYDDVLADDFVEAGSSTACLVSLNASGILQSSNLGDSGFCIIRSSSLFYNSPSQTHYFNCPRQLSKLMSPGGADKGVIKDFPSAAHNCSARLRDGDIIILYTDGLSDNVFPGKPAMLLGVLLNFWTAEIVKICTLARSDSSPEQTQAQIIAQHLIHYARLCMFSDRVSPFETEARRNRLFWRGGKVDECVT
ncbi:phosphatase 2C-like domain-containing protein [Mycena pura]|uniref:Protein phosphatase n=1 Tax=Mycena pura TaxID=153505 RepID=A0AAD6VWB0_9AGAR|nr:phosphatase 2C-like domain-containing protein [Mycena pura]